MSRCCFLMASCCAFNCCLGVPVWFCGGALASGAPGAGAATPGAVVVPGPVVAPGAPGAVVSAGVAPAAGERTSAPVSMAELAPGWGMVTALVPRVGWADAGTPPGVVGRGACMGGDPPLAGGARSGP